MQFRFKNRLINNFDLLILTAEVLNPEFFDHFSNSLKMGNYSSSTLSSLRLSNPTRVLSHRTNITLVEAFSIFYVFFNLSISQDLHFTLVRLFSSFQVNSNVNTNFANKYLRKYRFYYKKKMHSYRVGEVYYENDRLLNSIAISYAYLLYLIVLRNDFYFFLESLCNFIPPTT